MLSKKNLKNQISYVYENSTNVHIIEEKIEFVSKEVMNISPNRYEDVVLNNIDENDFIKYFIICNALNFCLEDNQVKWKYNIDDKLYNNQYALYYAVAKSINNGQDLLNPNYLRTISFKDTNDIFSPYEIPMLIERNSVLHNLGNELKRFNNIKDYLISSSDIDLFNKITNYFSTFKDTCNYKGKEITFGRNAIQLINDLYNNIPSINDSITNLDNLLAPSDSKLANILRSLGVLDYTYVDRNIIVIHGSNEEAEIRANSLYSIELIKKKIK